MRTSIVAAEGRAFIGRRPFFCACCAGTFVAWAPARARAAGEAVVPVTREPHHHTRFENESLRIMEAILDPGDATMFHEHALDSVLIAVESVKIRNEQLGHPQAWIGQTTAGEISYKDYLTHPFIHRIYNLDDRPAIFLDCEIIKPEPGRFAVSDRSGSPGYSVEIDNNRVRAWRLKLDPGQSVAPITQAGPGARIVLQGSQFREAVQGAPERDVRAGRGSYEWQPAGRVRSITNTGGTLLEILEFELK